MNVLSTSYWRELSEDFGTAWNRFWFTPADPLPLAAIRIGAGLVAILHLLSYNQHLTRWFASTGLLPPATVRGLDMLLTGGNGNFHYSYLMLVEQPAELWVLHGLAIAIAIALTLGLFTRVTSVLTLLAVLSYSHRAPLITGQLEPVLGMILFYLCIGPAGARWSLDRLLAQRLGWKLSDAPSTTANIALRLLQVHGAAFYAMLGLTKLFGGAWWGGEAVWMLMAQTHSRPLDLTFLQDYPRLLNAWTHAIVGYELLFPILIWNRLARPLLLAIGVAVWLSIALVTGLVPFCLAMLVVNRAFVPAENYGRGK